MASSRWRVRGGGGIRFLARRSGWAATVLAAAWVLLSGVGAPAQEQQASASDQAGGADTAPQTPVFRTGINFVRVDAIVTDEDGNPVLDLTADDFRVFEDDVEQTVESFRLVEMTGLPDPALPPPSSIRNDYDQEREAARTDSRIFVFFLDDYHVRDTNAIRMRRDLVEFVETQLRPTDLVGIMYPLTPIMDMRLTRNHDQIVRALEAFEGVKYDYQPRNMYEHMYANFPTTTVELIRNDVSLSALKALAIHLGGLREGRKSVIVLSEGYSNYVPPQLRDIDAMAGGLFNPARFDPLAGESNMEQTQQFFEMSYMRSELVYTADIANRNNTSFYMVDPRGLATGEFDSSQVPIDMRTDYRMLRELQDTLHVLADETDGRAIVNRNDLLPGLSQIVSDQSGYYLLGYTSSAAPTDGEFHEIEVEVLRDDVRVRARKGYYALTAENAARMLAPPKPEPPRAVDTALATLAEPRRGRYVRTWVGARRGDGGRTELTFVWEPIGGDRARRQESASQVMLMAMSDSSAYFRGEVPGPGRGRMPRVRFDVDPGALELNIGIEDAYGDVLDRDLDELVAPDFTAPDVALSTPQVLRARNAVEMRGLLADADALPTASRFFRRTEQLLFRVEAYAPGDVPPRVRARLLSREGTAMMELPVAAPEGERPHEVLLQLSPFPRGDYLVELSAEADGETASTLVAFRVQP
ncbi:MAG: VWA domain-containing protein [Acidobacteria bacterium]|nr:VWA domain-containing protein [Acidobacteriota bacterium]